ncbi:MAG TPA: LptA/OstA family protein [Kiritimatiellia bacterium]|nr:LptA/OstA family protein [Kiritimatiellia bacterium]HMO97629.1 LptA/OstA family protein [Kiritimatiellia bacterium]HMP95989.1 LptA/OstA family protein [Kiritimatiellia bacterium]
MNKLAIIGIAAGLVLAAGHPAAAQKKASETDVTVITSERLTFDYLKKFALFEKDVLVVDPQMKIYADKMLVRFNNDNRATYIKAEGNVIIIQDDKRARGEVAEYEVASGEITLSGNPMITSGKNIMTADVIKYWRDDSRMEGKPRSRLVIYPEGDQNRDRLFMEPSRGR